jgi:hypothetical protein
VDVFLRVGSACNINFSIAKISGPQVVWKVKDLFKVPDQCVFMEAQMPGCWSMTIRQSRGFFCILFDLAFIPQSSFVRSFVIKAYIII